MKNRTKISKESLLSIGFDRESGSLFVYNIQEYLTVDVSLNPVTVKIVMFTEYEELERNFEFIDEITQLLTSLTGKTQFKK